MTPPTAATSSTIDVISNASRWSVRNSSPIDGRPTERGRDVGFGGEVAAARLDADDDEHLDEDRRRRCDSRPRLDRGRSRPRRVGAAADVRDHEQEHDDDGAGVDQHLRRGDELRRQQEVEDRQRGEVPDQRERGVERVGEADDRDRRCQARGRGHDPHDPDDDVSGGRCDDERHERLL